jgi:hypothetical protein
MIGRWSSARTPSTRASKGRPRGRRGPRSEFGLEGIGEMRDEDHHCDGCDGLEARVGASVGRGRSSQSMAQARGETAGGKSGSVSMVLATA